MNQDRHKRKLSAILSADVVGYSRLMEADEAWTIKSLEENRNLISNLIEEYHGRVVDAPGDNILAEFSSVTNAVECAVKIQKELKTKYSKLMEEHRMEFRIGINLGEIVEEGGRIYGSGVNIAARIEGLSKSGGICISGRTYDHVKTKFDFGYEYLGEHNVKNISEPIRVYRLLMESKDVGKVIGEKKAPSRASYRTSIAAVIILLIIAAVSIGLNIYSRKTDEREIIAKQKPVTSDVKETSKTIAVLPFEDFSPEKDQEYFVDGLSEEILNTIAQIPDLTVIARTSSFSFKGENKTIQEIANALSVEHILEGSVRKAGNAIRITAQLIRASDGSHLWSKTYDEKFNVEEMFSVQEDIATSVAEELKVSLGISKSSKQMGGTDNLEAYEHFLVAKGQMIDIFEPGETAGNFSIKTSRAEESLDAAIELDPEFALAWAFKAIIYWYHIVLTPGYHIDSGLDSCLNSALRAIELEPNLPEAHYSLGMSRFLRHEFTEAELAYRKAMELSYDPINSYQFGLPIFSVSVGSYERANEIIEASRQIDPLNQTIYGVSLLISSLLGDEQQAEEKYTRGNALFGDQWELGNDYITILRLGFKDTISLDKIVYSNPIFDVAKEYLHSPKEGLEELRQLYSSDENLNSTNLSFFATWAAYFGDTEFAMEAIEKKSNLDAGNQHFNWFSVMSEVRQLPRFKELVREIGLVDYWREYGWPETGICHPIGDDDFECE